MKKLQTASEKIRALPWALAGDAANTIYVYLTFAGPIFLLFLDKLNLPKTQIGMVLSIVPFCSLAGVFFAPMIARVGFKRVFLIAMGARKFALVFMIATPWVLTQWGRGAAFAYVVSIIAVFALCRAIAVTALGPWTREYVPDRVRGKFSAAQNIAYIILGGSVFALAGVYLGSDPQLGQFAVLYGVGFVVGLLSVAMFMRVPGGASIVGEELQRSDFKSMWVVLKDRQFLLFLIGTALVTLAWSPLAPGGFLTLFLKEQVGLESDQVLYFNAIMMASGVLSSFVCGWAADRYGSKPVLLLTLAVMWFFPLGLWLLPRNNPYTFQIVLIMALPIGMALPGWSVAYSRLLFVKLIPQDQRSSYYATYHAWVGVTAGLAPLLTGAVLQRTSELSASIGYLRIDPYTPLMWASLVLLSASLIVLSRLESDGGMKVARFAGMFVQGNPLAAMQALLAYRLGGVEGRRVSTIERLGTTRSPLSVEELVQGLGDPSFNVRYEAVVSIARTRMDPRLTDALIEVLEASEPDMCIAAAWGLGRLGDQRAIEPLRRALNSDYPLIRARAARALGTLGDVDSAGELLSCFEAEPDPGLKLAYAAALGALRYKPALAPLLELLATLAAQPQRLELALAIASIAGRDDWFALLARRVDQDQGDALGGVLLSMRRRLIRGIAAGSPKSAELAELIDHCVSAFGHDDSSNGVRYLCQIIRAVPDGQLVPAAVMVLREAEKQLSESTVPRLDYVMLILHALHTGFGAASDVGGGI